jgi:Ca2+-transporting ATPase
LGLLLAVIYLPLAQKFLGTYGLPLNDWVILIGVALTIFPALELIKWLMRRGWFEAVKESGES